MRIKKITLAIVFVCITTFINAQIKIFTGGNVTIGSTNAPSPGFKMQVVGNSVFRANTASYITSAAYIRGLDTSSTATTPDYTWWGNDQTGIFHPSGGVIGFSSNGMERMRIASSNIQINSAGDWVRCIWVKATTPYATGYIMNYGGRDNFWVEASGLVYSVDHYLLSDVNFKTDIKTIPNALNKVLNLRGVTYKWNFSDSMSVFNTGEELMGVIAQEVEKVVPEVVKTMPNGTKAVAYQNLIGLLVEAIKEQQLQIDTLKKTIEKYYVIKEGTKSMNSLQNEGKIENKNNSTTKSMLYQNVPNPFNETTIIHYSLSDDINNAQILIFNMQGNLIKSYDNLGKTTGEVSINGGEFNAGMYMYSLIANGKEIDTKRMILTK